MPQITELPVSNPKASAPGWAYVSAALAPDPSKIAIQPSSASRAAARKVRNYNTNSLAAAAEAGGVVKEDDDDGLTARQRNEIKKRIAALDRENARDVVVPLPARAKGKKASTPAVRKILSSQKTFANHLDDEEAALATARHHPPTSAKNLDAPIDLTAVDTPAEPSDTPDTETLPRKRLLSPPLPPFSFLPPARPPVAPTIAPPPDVTAELLSVPKLTMPSPEEIEKLLSVPPLSYNAARGVATRVPKKNRARRFCAMCGYWGRAGCKDCESRVCGLDCLKAHRESGACRNL